MANLGEVANVVGMLVPNGFVITASAYERLIAANDLQPEIDRLLQAHQAERLDELFALSSSLQALIMTADVPEDIAAAIEAAVTKIAPPASETTFALRSSALGEDSAEASFAGQYQSLLNVRREHLVDSYLEVVASKYTPQAMQYRLQRGLRDDDVAMSVGCLEMVDARSGGVAYTGNPSDREDRSVYISSAWGLPKAIVDGRFASDLLVVERSEPLRILNRRVGDKGTQFVLDPTEGVERAEVPPDLRRQQSLSDEEATDVAKLALRLESHFKTPVDVEWAITGDGEVMVLQCRPLAQSVAVDRGSPPAGTPPPLVAGGINASPGAAAGPIHTVHRDSDALSCPEGAVLVLEQPLPRWAAQCRPFSVRVPWTHSWRDWKSPLTPPVAPSTRAGSSPFWRRRKKRDRSPSIRRFKERCATYCGTSLPSASSTPTESISNPPTARPCMTSHVSATSRRCARFSPSGPKPSSRSTPASSSTTTCQCSGGSSISGAGSSSR
jgi:pyruvate,water dikinase